MKTFSLVLTSLILLTGFAIAQDAAPAPVQPTTPAPVAVTPAPAPPAPVLDGKIRVFVTDDPIFEHTGIIRGSSANHSTASAGAVSTPQGSAAAASSSSSSSSSVAGVSHTQNGADPRTMEIQADIVKDCPGITVTSNPNAADFVLTLRRRGGSRSSMFAFGGLAGLALSAGMKVDGGSLFDRNGDLVFATKERSVENTVKKLCPYMLKK